MHRIVSAPAVRSAAASALGRVWAWGAGVSWGAWAIWGARWILWPFLKWGGVVALPFVALIRGGQFLYHQHWPLPLAMGGGLLAAALVLLLYGAWIYVWWTGRRIGGLRALRGPAVAVLVGVGLFQGWGLFAPDPGHTQDEAVRAEYDRLHPLLRTSVATLLLVDDALLITDLSRRPGDYADMGLPVKDRSLHYPQADGYVHALDLHTRRHSGLRNRLVQAYFEGLGFRTRYHGGTAQHLHVALPLPGD
jgi:hypothetical protein